MLDKRMIELLEKYEADLADKDDLKLIEWIFSQKNPDSDLYEYLEIRWHDLIDNQCADEEKLKLIQNDVHEIILKYEHERRNRLVHKLVTGYAKVAAALLLPLIITNVFFFINKYGQPVAPSKDKIVSESIHAPLGSRVSFELPDGTTGWLNSGSDLIYYLPFSQNRKVSLKGEAWFDVKRDSLDPFEIKAGNSLVRVLGTSFNLCAYDDQKYVELVLQKGKVEFIASEKKFEVAPDERIVFNEKKIALTKVDPEKYKAWTKGKLIFRGDNMKEVARRISRWYNVDVILSSSELERFSFRGTFEDDSLSEVLKLLSMTSPITYQIVPRIQNADGTYRKEKVVIYTRKH
jgi:ferric-dicitrate binding protein FerR (iron transport regulator)